MRNITIDDTDPSITYQGAWAPDSANVSPLYNGGTLASSTDPNAYATFVFTGVAVYYLSPLWTNTVSVDISIDSEDSVSVNLTSPPGSPETSSQPMWEASGLINGTHQVVISMSEGSTATIVDGFIVTVPESSNTNGPTPVIVGVVIGVSLVIGILIYVACKAPTGSFQSLSHRLLGFWN